MTDKARPALLVQALGITTAAYLSGSIFSLSAITTPAILSLSRTPSISHTTLAKTWRAVFEYGAARMPPLSLFAASCLAYSSYSAWKASHRATASVKALACASIATIAIVPFTIFFMSSTNDALSAYAAAAPSRGVEAVEAQQVTELLGRWGALNAVRSLGPLVGALLGASVLLDVL